MATFKLKPGGAVTRTAVFFDTEVAPAFMTALFAIIWAMSDFDSERMKSDMPGGGSLTAPDWLVDEEGRLRREAKPSMVRRCAAHDYCERSIYQITLTIADRRGEPLGRLMVKTRPRMVEHQTGARRATAGFGTWKSLSSRLAARAGASFALVFRLQAR